MNTPQKADPAIYPGLRENALLRIRLKNLQENSLHSVLVDWHAGNGTATVLAAADGTASIYLSSGGGFLGGGQRHPQIREAAILAVHIATGLSPKFEFTEKTALPQEGEVYFYLTTNQGLRLAIGKDSALRAGTDPLLALWVTMQQIVTFYRLTSPSPQGPR
jgi:hypothetical protein